MAVKREPSHPSSSFVGLLACVQTPSPLEKSGIERFFLKGGGGCTQARTYWTWLLPAQSNGGWGPLLNATDALKMCACDCTSHLINLWRPVSSVVTERKGSRHLCHLSNPSHQSHPSHPGRQRQLSHSCHSSHPSHASLLSNPCHSSQPTHNTVVFQDLNDNTEHGCELKMFWNMYFFEEKTSLFVWSWLDHLRYSY